MDIVTVLGITWRKASTGDLLIFAAVLAVPVSIFILLKIAQRLRDRRIHDEQLFLFKLKRLGLSNFQIKIVNNLVEILGLSNPNHLLEDPVNFERAIGRFLTHARGSGQDEESQCMICRDITAIYDKLYFKLLFKKPLKGLADIDSEQLLYFSAGGNKVFLGKIIAMNEKEFRLKIFGNPAALAAMAGGSPVTFQIFRLGDAEYEFVSRVIGHEGAELRVAVPAELVRREETRHPYVDVIIPARISRNETQAPETGVKENAEGGEPPAGDAGLSEEEGMLADEIRPEIFSCTIYKINDFEAVLRLQERLDFNYRYLLEFMAMDFQFKIIVKVIATKTVEEGDVLYYTVKFDEMPDAAAVVLKKYVYEHL